MDDTNLTRQLSFRLTDAEYEYLTKAAKTGQRKVADQARIIYRAGVYVLNETLKRRPKQRTK